VRITGTAPAAASIAELAPAGPTASSKTSVVKKGFPVHSSPEIHPNLTLL